MQGVIYLYVSFSPKELKKILHYLYLKMLQ